MRTRLDRLAAIQGRQRVVADLARDVRFHYFDEPLLASPSPTSTPGCSAIWMRCATIPTARSGPTAIDRLVGCPQPLRAELLQRWRGSSDPALHRALLEVYLRRFYRIRQLRDFAFTEHDGWLLGCRRL